ncbi:outer membrane protein assembly factor BamD [Siccirubricoccus sp. KC 17139]|uniref:Outer membrane protein assembly factor BamD n=1 Tax=Siccirubricoccus soli TaxID=2899147 RepID=A0ABT1D9E6_9PROT|nr:outer membrane protein assembly factor BamD [Siccirubricoccus soli]MCO6418558.1 outer membrane protein assembly factor BamD [Siccirubricoccus soli]MCP2684693.1 outer membrane protein assembly factor BamD [Siccirubricoccus soli]
MIRRAHLLLFLGLAVLPGCGMFSAWDGRSSSLAPRGQDLTRDQSAEGLYGAGIEALQARRYQQAVDYFDRVERDHPYSTWATNAKLMAAYGEYQRNRYTEAIGALDRFIQLHPAHRDIAYAYYLRALCYYEQISDAQRDQRGTEQAMAALQDVVNRYPDTAYARDARLKIDLGRDHLAGKEMNVGRFYQRQRLYGAAIGRFKRVVEDYQTTNHVPEALHRLTEIYLALGLTEEARQTASVLGHNFPGSPWYQDSYALLVDDPSLAAPTGERPGFLRRTWNWLF